MCVCMCVCVCVCVCPSACVAKEEGGEEIPSVISNPLSFKVLYVT